MGRVSQRTETTAPLVLASDGPDATKALAASLSDVCRAGDLVLLVGDLGAGKTTFAQGFGRALGVTEPVTSPTFTLVRRYPLDRAGSSAAVRGIRSLVHVDLYRLDTLGEVADLGLAELIEDGGVGLVEWGDVAVEVLGTELLSVRFEVVDDERRRITLVGDGPSWSARWTLVAEAFEAQDCAPRAPRLADGSGSSEGGAR
jgi:tRNA threonylcarbamoyladenosine biosynthesis protein TsaE